MISTGSMSDPYQPIEKKWQLTRTCLQLIDRYGFGATLITKSDLVLRDLDLLAHIHHQAKAVVQLSGGNAAVGGGSLDLYGKTTLQSDVTAKGAIKGGDIEMKNMKVSSSFKSPSTSEDIAMPGAPATGKLSAKLKEEELK